MYQIITVRSPTVHAKDAPRRVIPAPKISFADDAQRCNARFRRTGHNGQPQQPKFNASNHDRLIATQKRDAQAAKVIHKLLADTGVMSRADIMRATGLSDDVSKRVLRQMREAKLVILTKPDASTKAQKWGLA